MKKKIYKQSDISTTHYALTFLMLFILILTSCSKKPKNLNQNEEQLEQAQDKNAKHTDTYTNPLLDVGAEPWAIFHDGYYYYTHGTEDKIIIWKTKDITDLANAPSKKVWIPQSPENAYHLWAPEIHLIDDKWYIYFSADDGQMDNHQIWVIENDNEDPLEGEFKMKGRVKTDKENNWAIHASVFQHNEELYMIWSGWQSKRIETEIQCIYIAKMKNPWELSSDRVMISKPEYEWERQWINPDGSKTAYPIYVNEAPQYFHTKNKDKILIYYSASGNWSPYYNVGLLTAVAGSNLLDSKSWEKQKSPVFKQDGKVYGTGNICFIPSPNKEEVHFLYHARDISNDPSGGIESRSPRLQKVDWDESGLPVLGKPYPTNTKLKKPSK